MAGGKKCCSEVTLNLDCKGYPPGVPKFKLNSNNEKWLVRPGKRNECVKDGFPKVTTDDLRESFGDIEPGELPLEDAQTIANGLNDGTSAADIKALDGEEILDKLSDTQLHHKRPDWAQGGNEAANLIPLTKDQHTRKVNSEGVHDWWNNKIKENKATHKRKVNACMEETKKGGGAKKSAPKCGASKKTGGYHECGLTTIAKCLKDNYNQTKLYVRMNCPDAVK